MWEAIFDGFSKLGPALGSVLAVAGIAYFAITGILKILTQVLSMFQKHGDALQTVSANMGANTNAMSAIAANVEANTRVTEKVLEKITDIIEKKRR